MTSRHPQTVLENPHADAGPARRGRGRWREGWPLQRLVIVAVAVLGICVLLYPTAAAWFSDHKHATDVNGYVSQVESMDSAATEAQLAEARRYNENLPGGPLRDPWALDPNGQQTAVGDGTKTYFNTLDGLSGGMMARIRIPRIDADLPVFHGTDEDTLKQGVGHLYGSGLPVGGVGNHSVLTAHSGLVNSTLFTELHLLETGDVFSVTVLDEVLYYEVDQILSVEPDDTQALRQDPDSDYLTLITCTPIGINTHRLLVRGERVDGPAAEEAGVVTLPSQTQAPGFPWWAVGLLAGTAIAVIATRPRHGKGTLEA